MSRLLLGLVIGLSALLAMSRLAAGGSMPAPEPLSSEAAPVALPVRAPAIAPAPIPRRRTPVIERLARLESRRRLALAAQSTYLDSMFTTADSLVRRWQARPRIPLRLVVSLPPAWSDRAPRMQRALEIAAERWNGLRLGVAFQFGADTLGADIVVQWIDRFDFDRTGQADIQFGSDGLIRHARVTLASHAAGGRPLEDRELALVATHELGHALGLPHSSQPTDVMYPAAEINGLSDRDRATAALLYALPPGSLQEPAR